MLLQGLATSSLPTAGAGYTQEGISAGVPG